MGRALSAWTPQRDQRTCPTNCMKLRQRTALSPRHESVLRISGLQTDSKIDSAGSRSGSISPAQTNGQRMTRRRWTADDESLLKECYRRCNHQIRGFRKRLLTEWRKAGGWEATEQQLCGQIRRVLINQHKKKQAEKEPDKNSEEVTQGEVVEAGEEVKQGEVVAADKEDNEGYHDETEILELIKEHLKAERIKLPVPRKIKATELRKTTATVNQALRHFDPKSITELNELQYAAALTVLKPCGVRIPQARQGNEKKVPRGTQQQFDNRKYLTERRKAP